MQLTLPTLSQPLKLWEKIELVVGDDAESGHYMSRIEDIGPNAIVISSPEFFKGKSLLKDNVALTVLITREDAIYHFRSIISRCEGAGGELFQLSEPSGVKRMQRRRFVRVSIATDLMYSRIMKGLTDESDPNQLRWHISRSVDFSAGGILIHSADKLKSKEVVLLKIDLFGEIDLPNIVAAICRRVAGTEEDQQIGLEFVLWEDLPTELPGYDLKKLPKSVRQFANKSRVALEAYVFKCQIEMRKKGLL